MATPNEDYLVDISAEDIPHEPYCPGCGKLVELDASGITGAEDLEVRCRVCGTRMQLHVGSKEEISNRTRRRPRRR